jgi:hypothetical protein
MPGSADSIASMNALDPSAAMTAPGPGARAKLLDQFEGAWRDGAPVFACCRRSVAIAVEQVDVYDLMSSGPTERVHMLRAPVEAAQPGHLASHRCCANHLADLAFDAPELIAERVHSG